MYFFINSGVGYTNTGVEHAIFNRMAIFDRHQQANKLVTYDWFSELHDNIKKYGISDDQVLSLYDWFTESVDFVSEKEQLLMEYQAPSGFVELDNKSNNQRSFATQLGGVMRIQVVAQVDNRRIHHISYYDPNGKLQLIERFDSRGFVVAREQYEVNAEQQIMRSRRFFSPTGKLTMEMTYGKNFLDEEAPDFVRLFDYRGQTFIFDGHQELLRFFLDEINTTYGGKGAFISDRALHSSWSVLNMKTPSFKSMILHSTHISDEKAPDGLLNYNYENEFQHLTQLNSVIVPTQVQSDKIVARFGLPEKFYTIPVGMIPDETLARPKKGRLDRHQNELITVSRLDPIKHIDDIIKAVKIVHETYQDVTLQIYGVGGQEKELKKLAETSGIKDAVIFHGHSTDLIPAYEQAQIFVAASINEGFGLTMMEAQSVGTPIIAYDVPYGPKEIVTKNSGQLITYGDINGLADAIIKTLRDQTRLDQMMGNAYQDRQRFSQTRVWQQWQRWIDAVESWRNHG